MPVSIGLKGRCITAQGKANAAALGRAIYCARKNNEDVQGGSRTALQRFAPNNMIPSAWFIW
jgi:hypothetical protein